MTHNVSAMEQEQKQQIRLASQASQLQQQLLEDLKSQPEDKRNQLLKQAKEAHDSVMSQLAAIPPGPERVQYLLSKVDPETSRLLSMHKLWMANLQESSSS